MSLMSIWNSRFSARSLLGGALLVVASASHAGDDQFTLGRTILLGAGDHGATIPLVVCNDPLKSCSGHNEWRSQT